MKTLGPIYLCPDVPRGKTWTAVSPSQPCPHCGRPLSEHKTAAA